MIGVTGGCCFAARDPGWSRLVRFRDAKSRMPEVNRQDDLCYLTSNCQVGGCQVGG
jgi:hypothetical protein